MKTRIRLLCLAVIICFALTACEAGGTKEMIQGRVMDAETGEPVEGAAVAIYWVYEKFSLPGLGSNRVDIGTTETLTDAQGNFTVPRYFRRTHYMGVYKKGYVCWSSEDIFNPYGKTHKERYKKRSRHRVREGMTIQLEPMPDYMSFEVRKRHGCFVNDVVRRLWTPGYGLFDKAIRHENELCSKKSN